MTRIVYVTNIDLRTECNRIPAVKNRASMVHALISSYGLLDCMKVVSPIVASVEDIKLCHSQYYIEYLLGNCQDSDGNQNNTSLCPEEDSDSDEVDDEQLNYGLGYDCPKLRNLWRFVTVIAGATLSCANEILSGRKIAINWCGGWHHAQRDEAEGFCYVNDIVIGIQRLRARFQRVLYIDLDVHHGNGVENSFSYSKRVFTLSFHQFGPGFYPCSGSAESCGAGSGRGYSANFPYKPHFSGELFVKYFLRITREIIDRYVPDACVIQCGGDAIAGDPLGAANLVPEDVGKCVEEILSWNLPTIFLGGGGYHFANTARYWTYLTSVICKRELDNDIPSDMEHFLEFTPSYELEIPRQGVKDSNTEAELERNIQVILENLQKYGVTKC